MFTKEKLVFDPAATEETDNVGAYLRASDGTLLTHTDVNGKKALDVNVENEVDIRALTQADEITVFQGTNPWVVSGTVAVDGVSAGGNALVINPDGSINVNAEIDVVNGSDKVEDTAHASGATGTYVLAVRQDTLAASTDADGDYASFKVTDKGALWVKHDEAIEVLVPTHQEWRVTQNEIVDTAELVVPADLTGRRKIFIQNVSAGNRTLYISHQNTVSASNGLRISGGAAIELDLAAGVEIWAISTAAGADLRIAEFANVM